MPVISSLFIYPIKSCAGIALTELSFDERGPVGDRRLMLVDSDGKAITLRQVPRLAQVQPALQANGRLKVTTDGHPPLHLRAPSKRRTKVNLWRFSGDALDMGDSAAAWFSSVIEQPCRLVAWAPGVERFSKKPAQAPALIAFDDRSPLHVVTLESLSELNRRLETPVPMLRFRPNVVLRECTPFAEDGWRALSGETFSIELTDATTRCDVTTLDPHTLTHSAEPLETLRKFRLGAKGVTFGRNAVGRGPGVLRVGDTLKVVG